MSLEETLEYSYQLFLLTMVLILSVLLEQAFYIRYMTSVHICYKRNSVRIKCSTL